MALRISEKERQAIRNLNKRAQRKSNRLFNTYGIKKMKFKTIQVKDFKTRQQVNQYKKDIEWYLRPATHRYVRGGLVSQTGNRYYFPIPREEVWEINQILRKRNRFVKRFKTKYGETPVDVKGKRQDATLNYLFAQRTAYKNKSMNFRYSVYKEMTFNPKMISTRKTLNRFKYAIKNYQSKKGIGNKQKQAFNNYLDALYNTFGSNARPLVEALEKLTTEQFIAFFESDTFADFYYVYDIAQANNLLQNMAQHYINFIDKENIKIDEELRFILESTLNLDSQHIMAQYGKGSLGGVRVSYNKFSNHSAGLTTYYVDLTPEEAEEYYLYGGDINALINILGSEEAIKQREKVLSVRR